MVLEKMAGVWVWVICVQGAAMTELDNSNPVVFDVAHIHRDETPEDYHDPIDALEIFGTAMFPRGFFSPSRAVRAYA